MRIRSGTPADIDVIVRHRVEMFREMGHTDAEELDWIERVSREYFLAAIAEGDYHAVLVESGETVVGGGGVVLAKWPGSPGSTQARRPWILNIYVERDYRRRGIARSVMENLIRWCRERGFPSVSLHASEEGRKVYEQLGFQPTNEMRLMLGMGAQAKKGRGRPVHAVFDDLEHEAAAEE